MRRHLRPVVRTGVMLAWAVSADAAAAQTATVPAELDDKAFWRLVSDLSEPDGYFEDENYVSNELGYERTMRRLQEAIAPGGVFVGVGPEQNFAYVAALRPKMAFVIDIRRQNLVEHLLYKALFELSPDRVDFLSQLLSRPRPAGLDAAAPVEALFQAYAGVPADRTLFERTLAAALDVLTVRHRFDLTTADRAAMRKVLNAFHDSGPDLMYVFRGTAERHPTYAQMMGARDEAGRAWSVLGTPEAFDVIREMQRRNLIVPVVGDFAGPKAVRAVGAYIRQHGATINTLYVSNVEPYLFAAGTWKAFYDSVATLPLDPAGLIVRTFFGATMRQCSALRPTIRTPVLASIGAFVTAHRGGEITTQCDLVRASR